MPPFPYAATYGNGGICMPEAGNPESRSQETLNVFARNGVTAITPARAGADQTPRAYRGWVRTALTQPPPPIVGAARNLSNEKPHLTEPGRQGNADSGRAPQPR